MGTSTMKNDLAERIYVSLCTTAVASWGGVVTDDRAKDLASTAIKLADAFEEVSAEAVRKAEACPDCGGDGEKDFDVCEVQPEPNEVCGCGHRVDEHADDSAGTQCALCECTGVVVKCQRCGGTGERGKR